MRKVRRPTIKGEMKIVLMCRYNHLKKLTMKSVHRFKYKGFQIDIVKTQGQDFVYEFRAVGLTPVAKHLSNGKVIIDKTCHQYIDDAVYGAYEKIAELYYYAGNSKTRRFLVETNSKHDQ